MRMSHFTGANTSAYGNGSKAHMMEANYLKAQLRTPRCMICWCG
jgi:hypothetical protein